MDCDRRAGDNLRLQMPPVRVVCGAGALGRYHSRPERTLRCTQGAERRTVVRLADATQDLAADTNLRFEGGDLCYFEQLFRILPGKVLPQTKAAQRNVADAAPLAIAHFEDT